MIGTIAVAGPTASGKTALAAELCIRFGGEVVSFDSMQLYKGLAIGTAKPDTAEMRGVRHHLFDLRDPGEEFSCSDFCDAAMPVIRDIAERGKLPVLCGGTGLYLESLLAGPGLSTAGADTTLRHRYEETALRDGNEALHQMLRSVDPISADAVHPNNVKRVIRALEIYELTGIPKSEWDRRSLDVHSELSCAVIVLEFADRALLHERIARRTEKMFEDGIEAEARALWDKGILTSGIGAAQAIGYKEFIPYFRGECSLSDVCTAVTVATRRYAKRQITWFARRTDAIRITVDANGEVRSLTDIADEVSERLSLLPGFTEIQRR